MLASDFTWSDDVDYVVSKVNQRLGLLRRIKHLLPFTAGLLFYNSLLLPVFDYGDLVWGDKNNVTLMNDLQVLQNKAAKIILDRPLYSSATDALVTLKWLNLEQRRSYHCCIYIYKCINGLMDHSMNLLTNSDIHYYNTRNKDMLRLPRVTRNWGKQRVCHHSLKDWNELERERPEMRRILLLLSETCLPGFLINPIGKNFCSFNFFAFIIFIFYFLSL